MSFTSQALGLLNTAAKAVGGAKIISAAAKDAEVKKAEAILGTEKERIDINKTEALEKENMGKADKAVKAASNKLKGLEASAPEDSSDPYEYEANISKYNRAVQAAKENLAAEKALRKEQRLAFNARMQELEARKNAYNARATALGMRENLYKGGKK